MSRCFLFLLLALAVPVFAPAGDSDQDAKEAYETVKTAKYFTIGGVGEAGSPSQSETALRQILKEPQPIARCQKLLVEATPSGQLYGLLGLRLLDQQAFQAALPRYNHSNADIPSMRGCIVMHTTAAKLAKKIEKGELK